MSNKTSLAVSATSKKQNVSTVVDTDSEISKGLKKRIDDANKASTLAEEKIKDAFEYATKVDKLKPREAAKVLYDRLSYSPQWIRRFLPTDAKMVSKARLVQPKRHNRQVSHIITPPRINIVDAELLPKDEHERERVEIKRIVLTVSKDKVKKFYNDILKIREKAEKAGLKINSDLTVEVFS